MKLQQYESEYFSRTVWNFPDKSLSYNRTKFEQSKICKQQIMFSVKP